MLTHHNPATIVAPASRYSQAVEAPAGCRWLYISGQIGVGSDGAIEKGFEAQARRTWSNLIATLNTAGMGPRDLMRINIYLTRADDLAAARLTRDEALAGVAPPAGTLVVVAALAHPDLLIEIEAVAAKV